MFGGGIWDKLPECIVENFEIARVKYTLTAGNDKSARGQLQNNSINNPNVYYKQPCD